MSNDVKIREALAKIEKKKEELGDKPKPQYFTNGMLPVKYISGSKSINTLNSEESVVEALSLILKDYNNSKEARDLLGLKDYVVKLERFTLEEWVSDLKQRLELIQWNSRRNELSNLENALEQLKSEEAKTEDALSDLLSKI